MAAFAVLRLPDGSRLGKINRGFLYKEENLYEKTFDICHRMHCGLPAAICGNGCTSHNNQHGKQGDVLLSKPRRRTGL